MTTHELQTRASGGAEGQGSSSSNTAADAEVTDVGFEEVKDEKK